MGIGNKLDKLIKEKGTNVNELAKRANVASTTLYSIIKRNNTKADIDVLIRIASILDVPVEYFSDNFKPESSVNNFLNEKEKKLLAYFRRLNSKGQEAAINSVIGSTTIPEYTAKAEKEKITSAS